MYISAQMFESSDIMTWRLAELCLHKQSFFPVANPGFPRGGAANPGGGVHQHTIWPIFLYENKEILAEGARVPCANP